MRLVYRSLRMMAPVADVLFHEWYLKAKRIGDQLLEQGLLRAAVCGRLVAVFSIEGSQRRAASPIGAWG